MPMLDTQLRVDHTKYGECVRHTFYQKPCSSKLVLMNASAMPVKTKIQTLSNDIVRRMRNTDRSATTKERADLVTDLMVRMARSGYPPTVRNQVARAGLQGYYTMVRSEREGRRPVNRTRDPALDAERTERKLTAPTEWFRDRAATPQPPPTPLILGTRGPGGHRTNQ